MKLTAQDYEKIAECFPVQRGNVSQSNLDVLNAILYVLENGCKWRALPKELGNWHTVYTRMNRWSKSGVLHCVFERLQRNGMMHVRVTVMSLDSTSIRVHPDGAGALKKTARNLSDVPAADSPPNFIWLPLMSVAQSSSAFRQGRKATRHGDGN